VDEEGALKEWLIEIESFAAHAYDAAQAAAAKAREECAVRYNRQIEAAVQEAREPLEEEIKALLERGEREVERGDALREKLRIAESDAEYNYTQGIARGGLIAMKAINAMPTHEDHSRADRVSQYFVRADCVEVIRRAIDAARGGEKAHDSGH